MKICYTCQVGKPEEEFSWKVKGEKRSGVCKDCHREYRRNHYIANRQKYLAKARARHVEFPWLTERYNISVEEHARLLSKFDGMCWSCKSNPATHVDHDHSCCSGRTSCGACVRGVLCAPCNQGLGLFRDDTDLLKKAIDYLESNAEAAGAVQGLQNLAC